MRRPRGPRSLGTKLALLFAAITAAAFGILYFVVVPELESNLVERRLNDLEQAAGGQAQALSRVQLPEPRYNELVRSIADETDSVVTVLDAQVSGVQMVEAIRPYVVSDSRAKRRIDEPVAIARRVFESGAVESAIERVQGERVIRLAWPIRIDGQVARVAVFTRGLDDVDETVGLIRSRVLLATALALLAAIFGGYLVARALARRVRRLEAAAEDLAAGRFAEPLPIDSDDELGQLTRAFNGMQEQLQQVDRARKEFIATASHELRTPLTSLGGFVELLQDEELEPATRDEFLRELREQVERLQKLSADLLDLSRLDAGSLELRREPVDVAELVRSVAAEFRPVLKDRPERVALELADDPVIAVCDRERVAQIMRILLDNALRHTPEGTPVSVAAGRRDGIAAFSVVDRGPGLSPEAAGHVFERFFTADAARGSGLGLAIAKELAELMDGRIAVRSRPGQTIFTVELPTP
jgi:two-component system OmpR family sensor kinase